MKLIMKLSLLGNSASSGYNVNVLFKMLGKPAVTETEEFTWTRDKTFLLFQTLHSDDHIQLWDSLYK